ncbi:hypothetical protein D3C73_1073500 [compost metagenome]
MLAGTANWIWMRPWLLPIVMLRMVLVISSELGTIKVDLSLTWISVERTLMRLISPSWSPSFTQSPIFTGRSVSRIRPETKFWMIACRPKPIPTESALTSNARFFRFRPIAVNAHRPTRMMPT